MSGLLCSGDLYLDRFDDAGASTGLVNLNFAKKFAITESADTKTRTSKARATFGQAASNVIIKKPAEISIEIDEIDARVLAMALMGNTAAATQTSSTVTEEAVTAKLGIAVPLAKGAVADAGFVVTDSTGTTTYVEGTDYTVERTIGMLTALSTGDIEDSDALKVSYSAGVIAGSTIKGGAKPSADCALVLVGKNLDTGKAVIVRVDKAALAPTSDVDFMSDDFVSVTLGGQLITLDGKDSPYTVESRS